MLLSHYLRKETIITSSTTDEFQLLEIIKNDDLDGFLRFFNGGIKQEHIEKYKDLFFYAVRHGSLKICQQIPKDPIYVNSEKETFLHVAVKAKRYMLVRHFLPGQKSYTIARQCNGRTPLLFAAFNGDCATCSLLLKYASLSEIDENHVSAIHLACVGGHVPLVKMLVDTYGAYVDHTTIDGETPLSLAVQSGSEELCEYLIQVCAKVEPAVHHLSRPIVIAYKCGYPKIFSMLIKHGARVDNIEEVKEKWPEFLNERSDDPVFHEMDEILKKRKTERKKE